MTMPRILVIHPGHPWSTADVFDGLVHGLAANGSAVSTFALDEALLQASALIQTAKTKRGKYKVHPSLIPDDVYEYAARGVAGAAMYTQAEFVIAVTGSNLHPYVISTLRKGGIHTALLCTETPYLTKQREAADASWYDTVFTHERLGPPLFIRNDPATVHYLPHAFHPERHQPGPVDENKASDVYFVGTGFEERRALFGGVNWNGVQAIIHGPMWDGSKAPESLTRITPNEETVAWRRSTKIELNHHRTSREGRGHIKATDAESLGPRAYESAAIGTFQLCDDSRPELHDIFDGSVPTYRSGDSGDLEAKIRYYLQRPDERDRLRAAAHQAVQAHSWTHRAAQMLDILHNARQGVTTWL